MALLAMLPAIIGAAPLLHMLRFALELALALPALCGIAFYLIALWSAYLFRAEKAPNTPSRDLPVSVLKPLKGADASTYAALRSHCMQEYGAYEILFGVNDANDPAVSIVERLTAEFPDRAMRLVVCSNVRGANRKVSNLMQLLEQARYGHVLVNDGDILVGPNYLRNVVSYFGNVKTGMVTCLYRGRAATTFSSRMEAIGIGADFIPGVLTAKYIEGGLNFALGSTLAMSQTALESIGGFASVVDYLADDYELGRRVSAAGFDVVLAREIVDTAVPPYTFRGFWQHQLRWARTMRVARPSGYRGIFLTFGLPWAILLEWLAPHSWWALTLLGTALLTRIAVVVTVASGVLRDRETLRNLWLLPIRDFLALAIWIWSYADDTVTWSGERFRVKEGRMVRISGSGSESNLPKIRSEAQRR